MINIYIESRGDEMKKVLILIFSLLFLLFGCQSTTTTSNSPIEEDLIVQEFILRKETSDLIQGIDVKGYFEIGNRVYISFLNQDETYSILVLDEEFTVIHTLLGYGQIISISQAEDDQKMIVHHYKNSQSYYDIIDLETLTSFSMDPSYSFYEQSQSSYEKYSYGQNNKYYFVRKIGTSTEGNNYQLVLKGIDSSDVIFEFISEYSGTINVLPNQTFLFGYRQTNQDLYTLVQIDVEGNILFEEKVDICEIDILPSGYILTLFDEGVSYRYISRDLNSNTKWNVVSTNFMYQPTQEADHIIFRVGSPREIETIEYDSSGNVVDIVYRPENFRPGLATYELSPSTSLLTYHEYISGRYIYHFDIVDSSNIVLTTKSYDYPIITKVFDEDFFIYGMKDSETFVDYYDSTGNLVTSTNLSTNRVISISSDGDIILQTTEGNVEAWSMSNQKLWTFGEQILTPYFYEITNDLYMLSNFENTCPFVNSYQCPIYSSFIIDNHGNILKDYSSQETSYIVYKDDNVFYMYSYPNNFLEIFDYSLQQIDEYEIFFHSYYHYYSIKEDKLIIFSFPTIETPQPYYLY